MKSPKNINRSNFRPIWLLAIVVVAVAFSCGGCKAERKPTAEKARDQRLGRVVVVVHSDLGIPVTISSLPAFDKSNERKVIDGTADTVELTVYEADLMTVMHRNMYNDTLLVRKGDTVFLDFQKGTYSKRVNNNETEAFNLQYYIEGTSILTPDPVLGTFYGLRCIDIRGDFQKDRVCHIEKKVDKLDSVQAGLIKSRLKAIGELYGQNAQWAAQRYVDEPALSQLLIDELRRTYFNKLHIFDYLYPELGIVQEMNSERFFNDSTILYPRFSHYINLGFEHNKARLLDSIEQFLPAGERANLSHVFDELPSVYSDTLAKYFRVACLNQMVRAKYDVDAVKKSYDQFVRTYQDEWLINNVKNAYDWAQPMLNDVRLLTLDNDSSATLLSIIQDNRGKVIYIDFWASWCSPCREVMPAAKALREKYASRGVVFIYLAIKDKFDEWKAASDAEGLAGLPYNFLVTNDRNSTYLRDINLTSIPRYLLYDQTGILKHNDAPGPDTEEISEIFDRYIGN